MMPFFEFVRKWAKTIPFPTSSHIRSVAATPKKKWVLPPPFRYGLGIKVRTASAEKKKELKSPTKKKNRIESSAHYM